MTRFAWVFNLDADFELTRPGYNTSAQLRADLAKNGASARALLGPEDVEVGGIGNAAAGDAAGEIATPARHSHEAQASMTATGSPRRQAPPLRGYVGRAWCPTPRALAQLVAAGAEPESAPPLSVLRLVNHRHFAHTLGGGLPGQRYVTTRTALDALLLGIDQEPSRTAPAVRIDQEPSSVRIDQEPSRITPALSVRIDQEPSSVRIDQEPSRITPALRIDQRDQIDQEPSQPPAWLLKRPLSFAGRGQLRLSSTVSAKENSWIDKSLREDGLLVEPLVRPTCEVSLHGFIWRDGHHALGRVCLQTVSASGVFLGVTLAAPDVLAATERDALFAAAEHTATALAAAGYFGPFGIDGYRYAGSWGDGFCALSEINARYTLGFATGFPRPAHTL